MSRSLTATYNINWTCRIDELINALTRFRGYSKRTAVASRGFLVTARLSCSFADGSGAEAKTTKPLDLLRKDGTRPCSRYTVFSVCAVAPRDSRTCWWALHVEGALEVNSKIRVRHYLIWQCSDERSRKQHFSLLSMTQLGQMCVAECCVMWYAKSIEQEF